jgi:c-di-AMP phosphodiesterase-like protein
MNSIDLSKILGVLYIFFTAILLAVLYDVIPVLQMITLIVIIEFMTTVITVIGFFIGYKSAEDECEKQMDDLTKDCNKRLKECFNKMNN